MNFLKKFLKKIIGRIQRAYFLKKVGYISTKKEVGGIYELKRSASPRKIISIMNSLGYKGLSQAEILELVKGKTLLEWTGLRKTFIPLVKSEDMNTGYIAALDKRPGAEKWNLSAHPIDDKWRASEPFLILMR